MVVFGLLLSWDRAWSFLLQRKRETAGLAVRSASFPKSFAPLAGVISKSWGLLLTQKALEAMGCLHIGGICGSSVKGNRRDRSNFGANPPISFCLSPIAIRGAPPPIAMRDLVVCSQESTARPYAFWKMRLPTGASPRGISRSPKSHLLEPERPFICRWRRDTGKRSRVFGAISISASAGCGRNYKRRGSTFSTEP